MRRQQTDPSVFFGNGGAGNFDPNKFSGATQTGTSPGQSTGTFDPNSFSGLTQTGTSSGTSGTFDPNKLNQNVGQTGTPMLVHSSEPRKVADIGFKSDLNLIV